MKKKVWVYLLASIMLIGMIGCNSSKPENDGEKAEGNKSISTVDIVAKVKENIELRSMGVVTEDLAKEKYYLNMDDIDEQSIEEGQINTGLETIAVVKAKSGKTDSVKAAFEKVKEEKKINAFYPGEAEAVDAAEIKVIGDYVGFFIIPDYEENENNTAKAISIFEEALK